MDNNEIKISVIIPIYNAYNYLRPAMDSVVAQTLREIEIICVDDGSTDHSLDILKEYQKSDERIRIVTETNAGPGIARNNGMRRARGKYIAFLDADDFFEPRFLETMYEAAERDELDVVLCRYDHYSTHRSKFEEAPKGDVYGIFAPGKVTSKNEHPDEILMCTVGAAWNKLFRRSFVENKELCFLTDVRMFEDVYFVVTALSLAERVGKVYDILIHHRIHHGQSSAKTFKKYHTQVPLVYIAIREFLVKKGMYSPLLSSYLNLSASRCFTIYGLLKGEAKESFWNLIHEKYVEDLGWVGREPCDFDRVEVCDFVANIILFDHKQYKKRLSRGREIRLDRMKERTKGKKTVDKYVRSFRRLFKRKHKTLDIESISDSE